MGTLLFNLLAMTIAIPPNTTQVLLLPPLLLLYNAKANASSIVVSVLILFSSVLILLSSSFSYRSVSVSLLSFYNLHAYPIKILLYNKIRQIILNHHNGIGLPHALCGGQVRRLSHYLGRHSHRHAVGSNI